MAVDGKLHAPSALLTGMTTYPLYRRLSLKQTVWMVRKIMPPPECEPQTNQAVARHYTDYAIPTHNTIYKRGPGFNSSLLYRYKAVRCGLNILASCEHGNEMAGRFLFYLENAQLLNKDSVRWRQLVKAICFHTSLLCHLSQNHCSKIAFVLDLLQIFSVLNVYMSQTECFPLSVIMALAHEKLEEADAKQTDCILEIRTGYGWKNYW